MDKAVQSILSKIDLNTLPVVPKVLLDLIKATQSAGVSFKDLANIIGQDVSLSSRVLAVANSSFYRQWGEVNDLNRAIVVLGLSTVKTIAITRSVQQYFSQIPHVRHDFLELIWYRSLKCGHFAHKLAKLTSYAFPDEAYLTGLLHRLGQLVLLEGYPQDYPEFLKQHFLNGQENAVEKQLFGASHNEVGGALIDSWNLQSFISDAVYHQYQPFEAIADSAQLVKIINLSGQIASLDTALRPELLDLADRLFGINQPLIEEMMEEVGNLVQESAESLGIVIAAPEGKGIKCLTPEKKRESIQKILGERIKSLLLSSTVRQQLDASPELSALIGVIQKDLSALFGFQHAAFFLFRSETNELVGEAGPTPSDSIWSSICINLSPDHSLLAKCLLQKKIMHSFDACSQRLKTIVDQQICRLMGDDGLLLIPLHEEIQPIGVIAVGISKTHVQALTAEADFLKLFAKEAGRALLYIKSTERPTRQQLEEMRDNYLLHVKKLLHEAKNPLSIINNYLYLLSERLGSGNVNEIRIIQDEIDRVGKLLLRMPNLLEDAPPEDSGMVDVNSLIIELGNLFQTSLFVLREIKADFKLDKTMPAILISKNKLKQILINLMKNAMEASPKGGKITITTKDQVYIGSGGFIEIKIEDEGPGLPENVLRHLYTPVVSTKGKEHSGLGLTICKSLIDELKGVIRCDPSIGKGTTFHVFLPRIILQPDRKM